MADTYRAALAHAAHLAGGIQALSDQLHIPQADLMRWIKSQDTPPMGVFLKVVDFIIEESTKPRFRPYSTGSDKPADPAK